MLVLETRVCGKEALLFMPPGGMKKLSLEDTGWIDKTK